IGQSKSIRSVPFSSDGSVAYTSSLSLHDALPICGRTTVIVRGQCLRYGDVIAFHGDITWQCLNKCWCRCVLNRDRLCMDCCQSTFIGSSSGKRWVVNICTTSCSNNI